MIEAILISLGVWLWLRMRRRARAIDAVRVALAEVARSMEQQAASIGEARDALAEATVTAAGMRNLLRRHGDQGEGDGEPDVPPGSPDPLAEFMARRRRTEMSGK